MGKMRLRSSDVSKITQLLNKAGYQSNTHSSIKISLQKVNFFYKCTMGPQRQSSRESTRLGIRRLVSEFHSTTFCLYKFIIYLTSQSLENRNDSVYLSGFLWRINGLIAKYLGSNTCLVNGTNYFYYCFPFSLGLVCLIC